MRLVSIKRIAVALAIVLAPFVLLFIASVADSRAIDHRRSKAAELRQLAERLQGQGVQQVLNDFGQPTKIVFHPPFAARRPGGPSHAARLDLTYVYGFRAFPWSAPRTVSLHVFVEMPRGVVTGTAVHETYGT